ncbi:MAG TPA: type II toxin-antitoxin system PemK/MazF family toxin [Pyrinomonadaceae bacterium]|nr:type II toxin-antitoxin system PemK/MazF family toxin [Pyrinomonadaceae bacterium]
MTCRQWEIVVVPFPFSDQPGTKRRPTLVLSDRSFNVRGHTILAMVTTSGHPSWPGDVALADHKAAGLQIPCIVRLKLFTLDNRLLVKRIGALSLSDQKKIRSQRKTYLPF